MISVFDVHLNLFSRLGADQSGFAFGIGLAGLNRSVSKLQDIRAIGQRLPIKRQRLILQMVRRIQGCGLGQGGRLKRDTCPTFQHLHAGQEAG